MSECDCWLMRGGSAPQGPNYRSRVAKANTHYMDLINSEIDEDKHPCYVLCGLDYSDTPCVPGMKCLKLAIVSDRQVATCKYCVDIRSSLEAGTKNITEVLY